MRISTLVTVANVTNSNQLTLGYEKRTKEFLMTVLFSIRTESGSTNHEKVKCTN